MLFEGFCSFSLFIILEVFEEEEDEYGIVSHIKELNVVVRAVDDKSIAHSAVRALLERVCGSDRTIHMV